MPDSVLPHVALELNGLRVGDLRAIEGLQMQADIAINDLGPASTVKKHVSNLRCTPGVVTVGLGMGSAMASWLQNSFAGAGTSMTGSVICADQSDRAQSVVTFQNAVITRCTLPALDMSSTDPAALVIEFESESIRFAAGDGQNIGGRTPTPRAWLCSGFKIDIGCLPTSHLLRVESMSWAAAVSADQIGIFREPTKQTPKITVPDLTLTIAAADRQAWMDAAKAWFVDGKHLESNEMQGMLSLLATDGNLLAQLALKNLGFKSFQTLSAACRNPDRFVVTLYMDAISLDISA